MLQMSMSKLSLKVLIGVFALTFSASVGLSAECKDDPNECTPKNLCEVATQVINDNKVWSEEANAAEHITFVKELGMECGVVEITDPCDLDPNECKVNQLCEKATTGDDGSKSWNAEAEAYVELAKEFKLGCGVNRNLANSKLNNIKIDAFQLKNYYQKLDLKTRKKIQKKLYYLSYYNVLPDKLDGLWRKKLEKGLIDYARAKALMFAPPDKLIASLNVKVEETAGFCTSDTVSQCSDKELCSWASSKGNWSLVKTLQPYVEEAQLRDLSCGVKAEKKETTGCETDAGLCSVAELCEKATYTSRYNIPSWEKGEWFESYVARAKNRNIDCGVLQLNHYRKYTNTSGKGKGDISIHDENKKSGTHRFYSTPSGWARFWEDYDYAIENQSINKKTNTVFPILKRQFVSLSKSDRIRIQKNLKEKQIYLSQEDGLWGRNTLVALVEYSSKTLKAIDLRNPKIVDILLEQALLDSAYYFKLAPLEILKEVYTELDNQKILQSSVTAFKSDFLNQSQLKRKQLQYALKELGYYDLSIDGTWGNGTFKALNNFKNSYNLKTRSSSTVFSKLLSEVQVPTKFAEPKRTTSNKSTKKSGNSKLTKIVDNPSVSADQAIAICVPQANLAGSNASNSFNSGGYGSTMRCSGFGNSFNCNSSANSGGFLGGFADGIGKGLARRQASNAVLKSCLAQYGWKTK